MSDWITFEENKPVTVELKDTDVEKKDNNYGGYQYDWNIKELDNGEVKFSATESLNEKMLKLNLSAGDSIIVEKVKKKEVFDGKPFFKVDMDDNPTKAVDPAVHESPLGAGFAQKDDKMGLHELSLRVETLEKEVNELKKNALPF